MIQLAAMHGLRVGEIARLRGSDLIETKKGRALVIQGKGDKERFGFIDDNEVDIVAAFRNAGNNYVFPGQVDGHLSARHIGRLISRALTNGWSAHKLRTRFATSVYNATPDLLELQCLLGHESPETTRRYVQLSSTKGREMSAAALQINGSESSSE